MKTAVDIYKLLPKTNCGTCGMPNCFGFAVKVASGQASITACATLSDAVKQEIAKETSGAASRGNEANTVLDPARLGLTPGASSNGDVIWRCGTPAADPAGWGGATTATSGVTTSLPGKYLPSSCR